MSQKVTRKGGPGDEKEKRTDSPVKDMKKKLAANAEKEKEKQAEKTDKNEKTDKRVEKNGTEKEKLSDKDKKGTEKKGDRTPTPVDKKEKASGSAEKKEEKAGESEKKKVEQKVEENGDKSAKSDKQPQKPKQNGKQNGVSDAPISNGSPAIDTNGTVSEELIDSDENEPDELFPELAYEDSDQDCFETTVDNPSRSFTRRSQVKATRTPETPRPASDRQPDGAHDSKETKVLKLKDDAPERKLRSAEPKEKKPEKVLESPKKAAENGADSATDAEKPKENGEKDKLVVEVIVEETEEEPRKTDTNFSKSRVKVSPYRRSMRLADQTNTSVIANYTGNNTTMEMDITETSSILEDTHNDSYVSSLRNIKGRRSYKLLPDMPVKKTRVNVANLSGTEVTSRPTAPVVGRKRKPDPEQEDITSGASSTGGVSGTSGVSGTNGSASEPSGVGGKRARLLDTLARTFTRFPRHTEIVGINTDLPLSAPVATEATEALKPTLTTDKRCVLM